jgi:hypothetical protein
MLYALSSLLFALEQPSPCLGEFMISRPGTCIIGRSHLWEELVEKVIPISLNISNT